MAGGCALAWLALSFLPSPAAAEIKTRVATDGTIEIYNDGMAEMCRKWPNEFPAFVASLPMNNPQKSLEEMDRAVDTLGAKGIQKSRCLIIAFS